jgi:hypothetical protein
VELLSGTGRGGAPIAAATPMKDAYSFHTSQESLQETYDAMYAAYSKIFSRMGLDFRAVQADTGCDRGVQRLHHGRDRNAGDRVARLAHESAQSLAF